MHSSSADFTGADQTRDAQHAAAARQKLECVASASLRDLGESSEVDQVDDRRVNQLEMTTHNSTRSE